MPGGTEQAGAWGRDEIRNITAETDLRRLGSVPNSYPPATGAFTVVEDVNPGIPQVYSPGTHKLYGQLSFSAARVVPTGPQNVPQHIWTPYIIYLGLTV